MKLQDLMAPAEREDLEEKIGKVGGSARVSGVVRAYRREQAREGGDTDHFWHRERVVAEVSFFE